MRAAVIGFGGVGRAFVQLRRSLECGINVVTANKGPILLAYKELKAIAVKNQVQLGIGCTTGGALPSINSGIMNRRRRL